MTSQNCGLTPSHGDEYSSLLSDTGPKVLVWTDSSDWTNLNLRANQNARRINSGPGIFIIDFRPIFWECTAFLLMKRKLCWLSTSKPDWVIFGDLKLFVELYSVTLLSSAISDGSTLISIPIVGFVQSESRTALTMTQLVPDAAPAPGRMADHPDFLRYMSLVENTAGPWFKLSVSGELGLNNAGLPPKRREKIERYWSWHSATSLPGRLTEYPRASGGGSRAS